MICMICNKEIKSYNHITKAHNITLQDYYDKFFKQENEGICPICHKTTAFISMSKGYRTYCSHRCCSLVEVNKPQRLEKFKATCKQHFGVDNPMKAKEIQLKTQNTCLLRYDNLYAIASQSVQQKIREVQLAKNIDYDGLLKLNDVIDKYGYGWYIIKNQLDIDVVMKGRYGYVKQSDIPKIESYIHSDFKHSKKEELIYNNIKSYFNGDIIRNSKRIIKPYQIDLFIPLLNLAIEYNSNFYHCVEYGIAEDYHLKKSLLCKKQNIRLIHIYEFEDIETQLDLLKNLILGQDIYPKNDFNKNNLINHIPNPEIVYQSSRFTVYGAGKLVKGN